MEGCQAANKSMTVTASLKTHHLIMRASLGLTIASFLGSEGVSLVPESYAASRYSTTGTDSASLKSPLLGSMMAGTVPLPRSSRGYERNIIYSSTSQ